VIDAAARNALIEALAEFSPEVVDEVLRRVDTLPFNEDSDAYVKAITSVAAEVITPVLQAKIDALQAESEALNRQTAEVIARHEEAMRRFEEFRAMKTDDIIH